jgi:hypothetical protein
LVQVIKQVWDAIQAQGKQGINVIACYFCTLGMIWHVINQEQSQGILGAGILT